PATRPATRPSPRGRRARPSRASPDDFRLEPPASLTPRSIWVESRIFSSRKQGSYLSAVRRENAFLYPSRSDLRSRSPGPGFNTCVARVPVARKFAGDTTAIQHDGRHVL